MAKWVAIALFVLTCFMVVLLSLGYLLSENEKSTSEFKVQLAQQTQLNQEKIRQRNNLKAYTDEVKADITEIQTDTEIMQAFETSLINNLTCVTVAQCQVLTVKFKNINCTLASNTIGAAQLSKIATHTIKIDNCPSASASSKLACKQNVCSLIDVVQ